MTVQQQNCKHSPYTFWPKKTKQNKTVEQNKFDKQMHCRHFCCRVLRTILISCTKPRSFSLKTLAVICIFISGGCSAIKIYTDRTAADWWKMRNMTTAHVGKNCYSFFFTTIHSCLFFKTTLDTYKVIQMLKILGWFGKDHKNKYSNNIYQQYSIYTCVKSMILLLISIIGL